MNYNHLFYFHVVAQEGSIARASKRLEVTQPTISEQLKLFEESLGEKLFERHGGALRLNPRGRQVLKYTEKIFDVAGRLLATFDGGKMVAKSRLEVGIIVSATHTMSADRLFRLLEDESTIVRVRHGDNDFLVTELLNAGLDILITDSFPQTLKRKGVSQNEVARPQLLAVAAKDQIEDTSISVNDALHWEPFIHYTTNSSYRWELDNYFRANSIQPDIIAEFDDVQLMLHAVAKGRCRAIVPKAVLEESRLSDNIHVLGEIDASPVLYALFVDREPSESTRRALEIFGGTVD